MSNPAYTDTARFLANPSASLSPDLEHSPAWNRREFPQSTNRPASNSRPDPASAQRHRSYSSSSGPASFKQKILSQTSSLQTRAVRFYTSLSTLQKVLLTAGSVLVLVLGILFLVFNERIFGALEPVAERWRETRGAWLILWFATFVVSFPPLIGYSSCVTLAGFVFGVGPGYVFSFACLNGSS